MNTYNIKWTSDGDPKEGKRRIKAASAATALSRFIREHPDRTPVECYAGGDGQSKEHPVGVTYFEIPNYMAKPTAPGPKKEKKEQVTMPWG